jgi:hypothetical protein
MYGPNAKGSIAVVIRIRTVFGKINALAIAALVCIINIK